MKNASNKFHYNDQPIEQPEEDRFGVDPFAKALARSIRKLVAPAGAVIALNGPYGSGKSSAVNLVLHHLREAADANEIAIVKFACWWFRGEEAVALAFFRELSAGLGPTIGDRFKKALPKLASRVLRAGSLAGAAIDLTGAVGVGAVTSGAMGWLSGLIPQDETVEKLHAELSEALADHQKRFLIIVDDIDRLSPEEALLIFRLVKSVGRLPNVIYLLVYDRVLAEAIVAERFPSEGAHYLEKIVQAAFELPEPHHSDLCDQLIEQIFAICDLPEKDDIVHFMNVFYDVIAPELKTPRDLTRLANMLAVTWPAVKNEVDLGDFIGLEALRLRRPKLYRSLRVNKDRLCGLRYDSRPKPTISAEYDGTLLRSVETSEQDAVRRALKRLFPPLETVWGGVNYHADFATQWACQRRACSKAHFDTYFRFSVGDETLPRAN
jgi:predicted KAP-like P-loop ATPase